MKIKTLSLTIFSLISMNALASPPIICEATPYGAMKAIQKLNSTLEKSYFYDYFSAPTIYHDAVIAETVACVSIKQRRG